MPARTAPSITWPIGRRNVDAVTAAQPSQAPGPVSQPQSSKNECGRVRARRTERAATRSSCVTAARQRIERSIAAILPRLSRLIRRLWPPLIANQSAGQLREVDGILRRQSRDRLPVPGDPVGHGHEELLAVTQAQLLEPA